MARYSFSTDGSEIVIVEEHGLDASEPRWAFYGQSTNATDNTDVVVAGHGPAYSTADDVDRISAILDIEDLHVLASAPETPPRRSPQPRER